MGGAAQWFQLTKKTLIKAKQKESNLSHARLFVQHLRQDLKSSGYLGCRSGDDHFPINLLFIHYHPTFKYWRKTRQVYGFNTGMGYCLGRLPDSICEQVKENSELLVIYNIAQIPSLLKLAMKTPEDEIETENPHFIHKGSMVLISDCLQADIFIATEVTPTKLFHKQEVKSNISPSLSKAYLQDAEVVEIQTVVYYLEKTNNLSEKSYSLFRKDLLHSAVEILKDIKDLQVQYGLPHYKLFEPELNNQELHYKTVASISEEEWVFVRSLRLKIIFANHEEWSYEFPVGNRRYFGFSTYLINSNFSTRKSSFIANHFTRKNCQTVSSTIAK